MARAKKTQTMLKQLVDLAEALTERSDDLTLTDRATVAGVIPRLLEVARRRGSLRGGKLYR